MGDRLVTSCFQELWAYSASGSIFAQLSCLPVAHVRRYCSTHGFICSVCPSVRGWKAVERFWVTPRLAQSAFEKCDAKRGSLSEMTRRGTPNQGTRCFRYSQATPGPSIVFWHGMNLAAFKHPWSTIVRMLSNPSDFGRSVIRSIDIS
jgi:hypothetical protein